MQISKYIAHAGVCSRRKADELVKKGHISVNGQVMTDVTYRLQPDDVVAYKDAVIKPEEHVYVLLNKPSGYVTTVTDERDRKTVLDLVQLPRGERVYPVGRLDRATTGLLLITNDGVLAQKLAHPRHKTQKKYYVVLATPLEEHLFEQLKKGIRLEDGFMKPDRIVFVEGSKRKELIVELHSGKNRIIRRMFAAVETRVKHLDRFEYAHLTKKGLKIGQWRFLRPEEVTALKKGK
jgi:23S rRNA pseudouridine2605 synthase